MFWTQRSNSLLKSTAKHIKNTKLMPPHVNLCKINIVSALLSVNFSWFVEHCWKLVTLLLDKILAFQGLWLTKLSPARPPETPLSQMSFRLWVCVHRSHFPKTPRYKQLRALPIRAAQTEHKTHLSGPAGQQSPCPAFRYCGRPDNPGTRLGGLMTCTCGLVRMLLGLCFLQVETHVNSVVLSMDL